jgi:hypothetical protein
MDSQALRQLFVLANAFKEGDLAVGGTRDDRVREGPVARWAPLRSARSDRPRWSKTASPSPSIDRAIASSTAISTRCR